MNIKNPAWLMRRISKEWMQAHLSADELHLLTTAVNDDRDVQLCTETMQTMVPASMLNKVQMYGNKVDQNSKQCHEKLMEKISSFCSGAL